MASFSSDHSGSVSFHTDAPGVSITRARLVRAPELMAQHHDSSPGPATYASSELLKASPLKKGIKFSLAKKPPGLFDVPESRVGPGPGQYEAGRMPVGVAEYRSLKSSSALGSPSGTPSGTPRRRDALDTSLQGSGESLFPTSARGRRGLPPRSPRPSAHSSVDPLDASSLSDISNASTHDARGRSFKSDREDLAGLDSRAVDAATLSTVRAKVAAALYTGVGAMRQDRAAFFAAADKNHDGFLDLAEVRSLFRRVLKCSQDQVSDAQVKAVFVALGGRRPRIDADQFFALLGPADGPVSASRRPSPRPQPSPDAALAFGVAKKARQSASPAAKFAPSPAPVDAPPPALAAMLSDVQRLHGDFDAQLEELGEISKVLDILLNSMHK